MASQKISQFTAITTLASGDYFPVVQASGTSNKRVEVGVFDARYTSLASGTAAQTTANSALASGTAAQTTANTALASGNAALTGLNNKLSTTGGIVSGFLNVSSQSIGAVSSVITSGVIALNFGSANNFDITLGGNSTLNSPTTASGGQCGAITLRQDNVGTRLLSYSGTWNFAGGTPPTLTTTVSGVDILSYYCSSNSEIQAILTADFQ
jgi:hypothetical protein